LQLSELKAGVAVVGPSSTGALEIVFVEDSAVDVVTVGLRDSNGNLSQRLVTGADCASWTIAPTGRWTFDADGAAFRLASEARRIQLAHLFDPFTAVESAAIDPLPHQIEAVYQRLLPLHPLRFVLADDPGAGKTIMSGLYIRELILRGDVERCLIVAPGSLVEQWQEELWDKFSLSFDILSRDMVEASRIGNPFEERSFLIARVDQVSRNDDLRAKLEVSDWDLVIVDEAHKMSAQRFGKEVRKTKRFTLGEMLRERARHFLLLTDTPHNGKPEDFRLFMSLLDPDRFEAHGGGAGIPDVSDLMRRYVKERLVTFDNKPLFPERRAKTVGYQLSPEETALYDAVTSYVSMGMNRADAISKGGDRRRGLAVGFALAALQRRLASSPAAIHESLRRRREKVESQLRDIGNDGLHTSARPGQKATESAAGPKALGFTDLPDSDPESTFEEAQSDLDVDDFDEEDLAAIEELGIDATNLALTAEELRLELEQLRSLERMAASLRASRTDRKWVELAGLLQSPEFTDGTHPRKLIVFTEHRDTLEYLVERISSLLGRRDAVVSIHGGIRRQDRKRIQDAFRQDPHVQILVATDAAGEGVNLQRANFMVNYDLPWNPNRIEQRFGRIHRIGQREVCHLWNLVAHETREGKVFERLFQKIEEQKATYGDQIYDVLGEPEINESLNKLLIKAIRYGETPAVLAQMKEVVDTQFDDHLREVLKERGLAAGALSAENLAGIRGQMEDAKAHKLQPGFVEAFTQEALSTFGGRSVRREKGRYEIRRVPSAVRNPTGRGLTDGIVHGRYERVTFDKELIDGPEGKPRADLIAPGHPLLDALIDKVNQEYGHTLESGAILVDTLDEGTGPRVLLYLDHKITDGRHATDGSARIASRRFQFVEVDSHGEITDPGASPYLNYRPLAEDEAAAVSGAVDMSWADSGIDSVAKRWAIPNLATQHFSRVSSLVDARIQKISSAVEQHMNSAIQYWDGRAAEARRKENAGRSGGSAASIADQRVAQLEERKARRLRELNAEKSLTNQPPSVVAAAFVVPLGLVLELLGRPHPTPGDTTETDRRAVAAVLKAERRLGRIPEEQHHSNPGFDISSEDPTTGFKYFIEVKGHKPTTDEIKVSVVQIRQGKQNPDAFRLAVVEVPEEPDAEPTVKYHLRPFDGCEVTHKVSFMSFNVRELAADALDPL
jgi:superfamily II DNA or RNA helicase